MQYLNILDGIGDQGETQRSTDITSLKRSRIGDCEQHSTDEKKGATKHESGAKVASESRA